MENKNGYKNVAAMKIVMREKEERFTLGCFRMGKRKKKESDFL